jgi:hypothetical protein
MPRPLRIEYPGARYHVMSRGDRREAIFLEDADRDGFCARWAEPARTADRNSSTCELNGAFSAPFIIRRIIPGAMPQAFA